MGVQEFIETIGAYVKKYALAYNIKVCSPIIAQAILESAKGTSELAVNANNFFGLKYKPGRCPTSSGVYYKVGSEQLADGTYTSSEMQWCKFDTMEACVVGYFDFINISRYANLKGVSDPRTYVELIREDGYATSLNYVTNLMNVIESYNLTTFDIKESKPVQKIIALDAGHGMPTSGKEIKLPGYSKTKEWWLNDRIADRVEELLLNYDCKVVRVGDTTGGKDISLSQRVKTANNIGAAVYVSVHHNAGINGGSGGGTTVYYYSSKEERKAQAQSLYDCIVQRTNLVGNRSSKVIKNKFYVIANTKMPAFLIENGYMDSTTDVPIILSAAHAEKTAQGIIAWLVKEFDLKLVNSQNQNTDKASTTLYRVQCGAFSSRANAEALQAKLKAAGFDCFISETK
jgi:N-acetylmuramoyl-L-alanine amidase